MTNTFARRFEELDAELQAVCATKRAEPDPLSQRPKWQVDRQLKLKWETKAKVLLEQICSSDSYYFKNFENASTGSSLATTWERLEKMGTVFHAAKEDFEKGYLTTARSLVQAEVFSSELEQSGELLSHGYKTAAAVIAGTVLETALRELCDRNNLAHGSLNKMNADLAKQGVYNANMVKRVTALAATRNSAAHGKPEEFTEEDVKSMIVEIERFLSQYLT